MSIKMGIYDFFAYTIPGGLLLLAVIYAITRLTTFTIDLMQVGIIQGLFFAIASYVVGYILDPLAKYVWYARFEPEDALSKAKADLNSRNDRFKISDVNIDWYVLLAFIRSKNMDMAIDIERFKATEIMMRNVSFVLLLCVTLPIIDLTMYGFSFWQVIVTVGCLMGCFLALKQSLKFGMWFYGGIFGTIAALELSPEFIPVEIMDASQIETKDNTQIVENKNDKSVSFRTNKSVE